MDHRKDYLVPGEGEWRADESTTVEGLRTSEVKNLSDALKDR